MRLFLRALCVLSGSQPQRADFKKTAKHAKNAKLFQCDFFFAPFAFFAVHNRGAMIFKNREARKEREGFSNTVFSSRPLRSLRFTTTAREALRACGQSAIVGAIFRANA